MRFPALMEWARDAVDHDGFLLETIPDGTTLTKICWHNLAQI